jgi:hypothetical protein
MVREFDKNGHKLEQVAGHEGMTAGLAAASKERSVFGFAFAR